MLCKLLLNSLDICTRLINLVYCNDYFYTCCLSMADSLYSLWHNTIISRYYKYSYIC